jgi:hypothetical protein
MVGRLAVRQDDDRQLRVRIPVRYGPKAEAAAVMSDLPETAAVLAHEESHRVPEGRPIVERRRRDHLDLPRDELEAARQLTNETSQRYLSLRWSRRYTLEYK